MPIIRYLLQALKHLCVYMEGLIIMNGKLMNDTFAEIYVNTLKPYSRHVYMEYSGKKLEDMINSIRIYGVLESILVRPIEDELFEYEIIAGHNRVKAAKLAGIKMIPAQIKEMTDDEADILMVETNCMRRTEILPSEKGRAYKVYLDAHNKQGTRNDLIALKMTSGQIGQKSTICFPKNKLHLNTKSINYSIRD